MKKEKEFDAVEMVRKIRDKQSQEYFKNRKKLFSDLEKLESKKEKDNHFALIKILPQDHRHSIERRERWGDEIEN